MSRLSQAGACLTWVRRLVFPLSWDDRITSFLPVLGRYVTDGAVQLLRIIDRYQLPHNARIFP